MIFVVPFYTLCQSIQMMPDKTGVRAVAEWSEEYIFKKFSDELQELRNAVNNRHNDVADISSSICREMADIFNLTFGLCLKHDCLFPGEFNVQDGPRKWKNVWNAYQHMKACLDLQTATNFLTQVVQYVKINNWKFCLDDVIKMMAIKSIEKGVKYGYIQ